jgi:hypothetical protein
MNLAGQGVFRGNVAAESVPSSLRESNGPGRAAGTDTRPIAAGEEALRVAQTYT